MKHKFITFHIVNTLPLHNLNRDQNGLPKSQFDGGVQRGRLSAQSLKRAARVTYRDTLGHDESMRTRHAVDETMKVATARAEARGVNLDTLAARKEVAKVIRGLTNAASKDEKKAAQEDGAEDTKSADNIIFISRAEIATLAHAVVDKQQSPDPITEADVVADCASPSLDIASFGRMFAKATSKGTHAAIAVSHAATTHQMALVADYFSAVEDGTQDHQGAGHIGMAYYTSGVYYRSFTVDIAQLHRSWSTINESGSREALYDLLTSLVRSLPTGRVTNSNPHTLPALVLVEQQAFRTAYEFDTPVEPSPEGGYKEGTLRRLAEYRQQALAFDPDNFGAAAVAYSGDDYGSDFAAQRMSSIPEIVRFGVDAILGEPPSPIESAAAS